MFIVLFGARGAWALDFNDRIDQLIQTYIGVTFPSAAVLVIENSIPTHQRGYGTADLEGNITATAATNYRLASVSKTFTALAIVILAEQGLINYEASITDYLEDFPSYGNNIKIRHLLHHQSGLKDYASRIPNTWTHQITDYDVVEILKLQTETDFIPGSQFCYSNAGYAVLAVIIAQVSKMSFIQFLHQKIFAPLGMQNTDIYKNNVSPHSTNQAYGYTLCSDGQFIKTDQNQVSAVLGDGGIYSSAIDMFHFDQALYHLPMISETSSHKIFTPGQLNDGTITGYGFGWKIGIYRNHRCISHIGSSIGFRSALLRFPDEKFSVFVILNETNTSAYDIATRIVDMYFDLATSK